MKAGKTFIIPLNILKSLLANIREMGRIAYCFMCACIRKDRWLDLKDRVHSCPEEFKPMEIPVPTFEVGRSLRKPGDEVTTIEPKVRTS